MKLIFHVDALQELLEARDWYRRKGASAKGLELVALVEEKTRQITESSESFPRDPNRSWARRARILGWPFALIFTVVDQDTIVVLAFAHGKRRPAYWTKRGGTPAR